MQHHTLFSKSYPKIPSFCSVLTLSLLLGILSAHAAQDPARYAAQKYAISLQNTSLPAALKRIAQQANIQLEMDAAIYKNREKVNLNQKLTVDEALDLILKDSPFIWRIGADGQLLITAHNKTSPLQTPNMLITAEPDHFQSSMTIDRQLIESMPSGNGDITSMLKLNPHVQFDNQQLSSKTPGEINPANISINGAPFYQNAFLVDGFNMNNDLDPGRSQHHLLDSVPGQSQGLALDIDLLDEIVVHDSNVSAAYGDFNGGVVEAKTRKPKRGGLHGKTSAQVTMDAWTQYHIHNKQEDSFANSGSDSMQPKFTKVTLRNTLEGYITDDFGVIANFSRKLSSIPLSFYSDNNVEAMGYQEKKQHRRIDNYFIKSMWQASDRLSIDTSVTHAPSENSYFRANANNSGYDVKSGGTQLGLTLRWDGDWAQYEQGLMWGRLEQSRRSDMDDWFTWQKSTAKTWGIGNKASSMSLEGGYGNIDQLQKGWQYTLDIKAHPFNFAGITHRIRTGLELSQQRYNYERLSESNTYVSAKSADTCTRNDGRTDLACSMGETVKGFPGQYLSRRTSFKQGDFTFNSRELGIYLEDEMSFGRFKVRPGVRLDNDDFMSTTTVSPRLSMQFDVFDNNKTLVSSGANRYYGRSIAAWGLEDGRNRLRHTEGRTDINSPWLETKHAPNNSLYHKLDVPYDDEFMLGFRQRVDWADIGVKFVHREGKDQIIEVTGNRLGLDPKDPTLSKNYKVYDNAGSSRNQTLSLTVQNNKPLHFAGMQHNALAALDFRRSASSAPSYREEGLSDYNSERYIDNPYIKYDGDVIRYRERPASNYSRPWTLRANIISHFEPANLTVTNFLRLRDSYRQVVRTGRGVEYKNDIIEIWEEERFSKAFTWDMRLAWEKPFGKEQAVFTNLDITNVLNTRSVSNSNRGIETYEVGRQFWLEVGYKF